MIDGGVDDGTTYEFVYRCMHCLEIDTSDNAVCFFDMSVSEWFVYCRDCRASNNKVLEHHLRCKDFSHFRHHVKTDQDFQKVRNTTYKTLPFWYFILARQQFMRPYFLEERV